MKSILVTFMIGLLCLIAGCKSKTHNGYAPPVFPEITEAQVIVIGDKDIIYPAVSNFLVTDSNIVVQGLLDDYWMQVYNRFSGQPISKHVRRGNGPEEFLGPPFGGLYFHNDTVKTFDHETGKVQILTMCKVSSHSVPRTIELSGHSMRVLTSRIQRI